MRSDLAIAQAANKTPILKLAPAKADIPEDAQELGHV